MPTTPTTKSFNLYELQTPKRWLAGYVGSGPNRKPFFFDCADCGRAEPTIKGFLGSGPTFDEIAVRPADGGPFLKLLMFCQSCFDERVRRAELGLPSPDQEEAHAARQ